MFEPLRTLAATEGRVVSRRCCPKTSEPIGRRRRRVAAGSNSVELTAMGTMRRGVVTPARKEASMRDEGDRNARLG